ncbi:hypothetical protein [Streptomyces sp. bgisy100]|uniref:hypothetical protein n=1 Tax=Streptomyces sp. bgisy100 TaxID=3413783 RepID=UPI003D72BEF0
MDNDVQDLITRARELAERAAESGDPGTAGAAQAYATLALVAGIGDVNAQLRTLTHRVDTESGVIGTVLSDLGQKLDTLTYRVQS